MKEKSGNLVIHYFRELADYEGWSLWLWEFPQRTGKQYEFNGKDDFGVTCTVSLSNWTKDAIYNNLGLIVKSTDSWKKKDGSDKVIKFYKMDPDKEGNYHVFIEENDNELYANEKFERITTFEYAKFIDYKAVSIKTYDLFSGFNITKDGHKIVEKFFDKPIDHYEQKLHQEVDFNSDYKVEVKLVKNGKRPHRRIRFTELYKNERFKNDFKCDEELGAICDEKSTIFKVWSPVSRKIVLRVYKSGTPTTFDEKKGSDELVLEEEMQKSKNGVFSAKISRNLHGFYYTYVVTNDVYKAREVVDIYAKSAGVNGLRGMVVDFNQIKGDDLSKIKVHPYNAKQLTVYETHIADLTSSETWSKEKKNRRLSKTFLGACLEGTKYTENNRTVSTGFDHVKELGVNAVQLLPIFDQTNEETKMSFNWGYNPLNYNVLEGGYSTNPYDGEVRIAEFKHLVKKYHEAGINIIMDVVYNHLYAAQGSNFDVIMPGYYFRYDGKIFSNASGCGNETASDMPMFRKFMIDSVLFWAKEYKIAGFRFDLMAIHDIETMNLLAKALHDYDKNIVIYGEPWCADKSELDPELACHKGNANKFKGYGFFSDSMRDALIRTTKSVEHSGWCANNLTSSEGDQERIAEGIKGTSYDVLDPNKIVNYASCHDNRTLYDRVIFDDKTKEKDAKRVAMLANSIVLTSNGISFILAGEEFARSKGGCDNSYNAPYKVNELDYSLKIKNFDMFKNYQKLIKFKQTVDELHLEDQFNHLLRVDTSLPNLISYELADKEGHKYKVLHSNGLRQGKPLIVNLSGWNLYLDTVNPYKELSNSTMLIPYETLIAFK